MYLSRVAGYGFTGSLLICGFEWYDAAEHVLALSANCVHTPLLVVSRAAENGRIFYLAAECLSCTMLRWMARLRPRFPLLIAWTCCCVPGLLRTPLDIRCAVGSACGAGYGCVWHGSACSLYTNCVHTPLYARVAAYGCIRCLSLTFMV